MMAMKRYSVHVKGREKLWAFTFRAEPEHVEDWRRDGLEVYEVLNTVPVIIQRLGLTRAWIAAQDATKQA